MGGAGDELLGRLLWRGIVRELRPRMFMSFNRSSGEPA
jgi:hypothetical protein